MKNYNQIVKIFISTFFFYLAHGVVLTTYPIVLKQNGISEVFIGVSAIIFFVSGALMARFLNRLTYIFKASNIATTLIFIYGLVVLIFFSNFINLFVWFFVIAVVGLGFFVYTPIASSIINSIVSDKFRPLILSLYTTSLCLGITAGSLLVRFFPEGNLIYKIAFISASISSFCYILINCQNHLKKNTGTEKMWNMVKKRPDLYFAKLVKEYISATILSFIVVLGFNNGYTVAEVALFITSYMLSGSLNVFIGLLAMKIRNRMRVIILTLAVSTTSTLLIYFFLDQYYFICALLFVIGICTGIIILLSMVETSNFFEKTEYIAANSALHITVSIAGVLSGFLTGLLMRYLGNIGFFIPIFILSSVYFIYVFLRKTSFAIKS